MIRNDPSSLKGWRNAEYKIRHARKLLHTDQRNKLICNSSSTPYRLRMKTVVLLLMCAVVAMTSATLNYGYAGLYNPLLYKFGGLGAGLGFGYGAGLLGGLYGGLGGYGLGYGLGGYGLGYGLYGGYPYFKGYY